MENKNYELIKFEDGDFSLDVNVSPNEDTVWLTQEQISLLFQRDKSVISRHIRNIFNIGELNENSCVAFFATELNKFEDGNFSLDVNVSPNEDTVWLTLEQISLLFERDKSVISRHINNILKDFELKENSTVAFFATVQIEGNRRVERLLPHYNLDMILAIGYRVKSVISRHIQNTIKEQKLEADSVIAFFATTASDG